MITETDKCYNVCYLAKEHAVEREKKPDWDSPVRLPSESLERELQRKLDQAFRSSNAALDG
jgi:hypothetical protein